MEAQHVLQLNDVKVKKRRPQFYVLAEIHGVAACSFVDTGSELTLLSPDVYNSIPASWKPTLLPPTISSLQADGKTPLPVHGEADFQIKVGPNKTTIRVVVAEISEGVILGNDYILAAPAEIRTHSLTMGFHEGNVPLLDRTGRHLCARVVVAETMAVKAGHEMVIPGHLSRPIGVNPMALVEPTKRNPLSAEGVLVGRVLVDVTNNTVPVRVMNVGETTHIMQKGTTIALASGVDSEVTPHQRPVETSQPETGKPTTPVPDHLQALWEESVNELGTECGEKIAQFLSKWEDIFSKDKLDFGRTSLTKHHIETGNHQPIRQQPRRQSPWSREETRRLVHDMLEKDVIEKSNSPWAAPVVLVKKRDGSTRFCVDYRHLNDITVKDAYAIPRIEDSINALAGAKWFSTLDLTSGYWQVELDGDAQEKSAFTHLEWAIPMESHAIWFMQCPSHFPETDGVCIIRITMGNPPVVS
ncbi:uncharacterized protein [Ptychodera flava]|uniref:uncharacterized protein n=1 Tax=Ptychodera flava TaxID=63121 RepID=UPI00396A60E9